MASKIYRRSSLKEVTLPGEDDAEQEWWRKAKLCPEHLRSIKWVADNKRDTCAHCNSKFTFSSRRHHCRACGDVFCNDCSKLRVKLPQYLHFDEDRICIKCHSIQKQVLDLATELQEVEKTVKRTADQCQQIETTYLPLLTTGELFKKLSKTLWNTKRVVLSVTFSDIQLFDPAKENGSKSAKSFPVSSISQVKLGSANMSRIQSLSRIVNPQENCLLIVHGEKTLSLKTDNSSLLALWLEALNKLLDFQNLKRNLTESKALQAAKIAQIADLISQQRGDREAESNSEPKTSVRSSSADTSSIPSTPNLGNARPLAETPPSPSLKPVATESNLQESMQTMKEAAQKNLETSERLADKTLRMMEKAKLSYEQSQHLTSQT